MNIRLNLTTPEGRIVISEDEIVAIAESTKHGSQVRTSIWLRGIDEAWNICDSYDEVVNMLTNSELS